MYVRLYEAAGGRDQGHRQALMQGMYRTFFVALSDGGCVVRGVGSQREGSITRVVPGTTSYGWVDAMNREHWAAERRGYHRNDVCHL